MTTNNRVLFVLGGLAIGGVETYVVRLAKELKRTGYSVDVLLLSAKVNRRLMFDLSACARVSVIENAESLAASSWVNAFLPARGKIEARDYDIVHVVDLLTLGFVFLNRDIIRTKHLSIGIYHSKELTWWRNRSVYFRSKLLELYDRNAARTLFMNEGVAKMAAEFSGIDQQHMRLLPLGIDLSRYAACRPARDSRKIVSVGRLVDFKTYNRHVITQLRRIREFGDFEYYVYGDGPERGALEALARDSGVAEYVHFMGATDYAKLAEIYSDAFCFVGSGTSIIEAAAAGLPSIVGIESIKTPDTCGLFADVVGADYNELEATTHRVPFVDVLKELASLQESEYLDLSRRHRQKAAEFDIRQTSRAFIDLSNQPPDFEFSFNRWRALASFFWSIVMLGPRALKNRFDT